MNLNDCFSKAFVKNGLEALERTCNDGVSVSRHALAVQLGLATSLEGLSEDAKVAQIRANVPGEQLVNAAMAAGLWPEFGSRTGPGGGIYRLADGDKRVIPARASSASGATDTQFSTDLKATLDRYFTDPANKCLTREGALRAMGLEVSMKDLTRVTKAMKVGLEGYASKSGSNGGIVRADSVKA